MEELVSIIVPIYKVEEYINQCVDSILNQTYHQLEIILVDDGSPDNCGKICDEYAKIDNRVRVIHKENGGLSSARNAGLDIVSGDYIWFVDSDDYIRQDSVEILLKKVQKEKLDIVLFNNYIDLNGKLTKTSFKFLNNTFKVNELYIIQPPSACSKLFNAKIWKDIRFKEGIWYEDLALIPSLMNQTNNIGFLEESLYYYRSRHDSIMKKKTFNKKIDDKYIALEELKSIFIQKGSYDTYKDEIEYLFIKHLLIMYSIEIMKYGKNIYKEKLGNVLTYMESNYPNWWNNLYIQNESFKTKVYLKLLQKKYYSLANCMNFVARKIFK